MVQIITITYTLTDAKGKTSKLLYHSDIASGNVFGFGNFNSPLEDAIEYFQEVGRRIDLICLGRLSDISMTVSLPLPTVKAAPELASDVEEVATFKYANPSPRPPVVNNIATFDHALFDGVQFIPDAAFGPVEIAYLTELLVNSTDALDWAAEIGGITDNRGEPVNVSPSVQRSFRRR